MNHKSKTMTVEDIRAMNYTDFVGWINQWNVLPGAFSSLNKWRVFGSVDATSQVLEVACTTGFSLRELSKISGCSGLGFDISKLSVEAANKNKEIYAPESNITYIHSDGYEFDTDKKFSHVIFGAALRFFPDPDLMLQRTLSFLKDQARILSTEFYTVKDIPQNLIQEAESVFGITPTTVAYKEVMKVYKGLDVLYEERNVIEQETDEELDHYVTSTVERACRDMDIPDGEIRKEMYRRLMEIKVMSNKLRPFQNYNVLVLRYNKESYPARYVELF